MDPHPNTQRDLHGDRDSNTCLDQNFHQHLFSNDYGHSHPLADGNLDTHGDRDTHPQPDGDLDLDGYLDGNHHDYPAFELYPNPIVNDYIHPLDHTHLDQHDDLFQHTDFYSDNHIVHHLDGDPYPYGYAFSEWNNYFHRHWDGIFHPYPYRFCYGYPRLELHLHPD
jgi:hypothetical protein